MESDEHTHGTGRMHAVEEKCDVAGSGGMSASKSWHPAGITASNPFANNVPFAFYRTARMYVAAMYAKCAHICAHMFVRVCEAPTQPTHVQRTT